MLYSLDWLKQGKAFPPSAERTRLERYGQNAKLFDNEHFDDSRFRTRSGISASTVSLYSTCCRRIAKVVGNFEDVISIPILLNYQRFISLKMADLVCGEHPKITGSTPAESNKIKWVIDNTNLFAQLYSMTIDISRFGDCPIRIFKNPVNGFMTFTIWDAGGWYPIVSQDGTNTITNHCLAWLENRQPDEEKSPDYYLHVQIHPTVNPGHYSEHVYHNGAQMSYIGPEVLAERKLNVPTGLHVCAVMNIRAFEVSNTVYGYDDYVPLDSILSEIITRVSQISSVLDKHADPAMTGPITMLKQDPATGERYLQRSKFYGINPDDKPPDYLTWDGRLEAAFKQLEFLINQLYILSEMGAALAGGVSDSSNAVSGAAMRFKMVNPLAKARRVSNALTLPLRRIISEIGTLTPDIDKETGEPGKGLDTNLPFGHVTVNWEDGLPDDPADQLSMAKLASGAQSMMPLEHALMLYLGKSSEDAIALAQSVRDLEVAKQESQFDLEQRKAELSTVNKPGPQDGTGVNPQKKNPKGTSNFQSQNNQKRDKE